MTYYDHLDLILKYFYENRKADFESRETTWDKSFRDTLTFGEFKLLMEKLSDKGLLMWDSVECRNNHFKISLYGIEFFERGGYVAQRTRLIKSKFIKIAIPIVIGINAVAILIFTGLQAYYASKSTDNSVIIQHERDIKNLYDSLVNVQMDRDSLEKRIYKLEHK